MFTERLWRSVKYEEVYLHDYQTWAEAMNGLGNYFTFYNHARPHQALKWRTPAEVYGVKPTPHGVAVAPATIDPGRTQLTGRGICVVLTTPLA